MSEAVNYVLTKLGLERFKVAVQECDTLGEIAQVCDQHNAECEITFSPREEGIRLLFTLGKHLAVTVRPGGQEFWSESWERHSLKGCGFTQEDQRNAFEMAMANMKANINKGGIHGSR